MSVTLYFGKTEHGKTVRAIKESHKFKRVVIYDNAHCVNDGVIITDFSPDNFARIFKKYVMEERFRLIFRAPLEMDEEEGARKVAHLLYKGFGFFWKSKFGDLPVEDRINFFIDEAEKVSSKKRGDIFYLTVTKGRHLFIDVHAITQIPGPLPLYYKSMASSLIVFNSDVDDYFSKKMRKVAHKLDSLPKYHYFERKDNGEIKLYNEKGKVYGQF